MFQEMKSGMTQLNKFQLFMTLICSVWISPSAFAAEKIYRCDVLSDAYIKSNGELDIIKDSPRIGQEFVVIKKTGEVVGDVMDSLGKPKVIAFGSNSNSYKVVWIKKAAGKDGAFVDYLSINGFAKDGKYPFGFFSGALLMAGVCE
ncbi:hypothetical protein C2742_02665 [Polynucleobacter paneuropaeus]|uniref:hypothetical protein n=2 Tax=Polynucleobacter paneuropaeus TaxID=2527775 RepID=UPI001BFE62A4|nr:hypothetical protein [Polynucleobacter paneuropaeus]QWD53080.1 hypothetical protein C2752_02660 [Polynucleobacter paneuropaeus]QWD57995.1 hypothetical protein C2742_02665 [Polynucleobacter paneuropaeus]